MKKIFTVVAIALFSLSTVFSQTTPNQGKKSPKKTSVTIKTEVRTPKTVTTKTVIKADGTPDRRYKENKKITTVVVGPKKKDGTADMRYKVNKPVATKKKK